MLDFEYRSQVHKRHMRPSALNDYTNAHLITWTVANEVASVLSVRLLEVSQFFQCLF